MTMLDSAELPLETGKFTEKQALDWLTANPGTDKTVREIAAAWGWSRSATHRFLSRGTSVGQDANLAQTGGTSGTSPESPDGDTSGKTPPGAVAADLAVDHSPPFIRAPYTDDFKWEPENGAVIVAPQQALAVYVNPWGQVVIRAAGEDYGEDAFIVVSREHLPALIARLSAIVKETE